ncbi:hypothetical protein LTR24_004634 [Lithohypha guttulata]|uniref:Uncharacterized protein n=1 Tax=Lithohypha guttulata TaxID=1690604 RepID=A0ABR0KD25_9EURO|nr:hypothetical protein LTR24_004634 [Lithohypha guttulata]
MLYKLGPEHVKSEFHMSLLCSQSRIMVMETIFTGKPCYLADPRWQEAMRRTILNCEDFGDRSRTSIELWALGTRIPNLFQSVSEHVHGLTTSDGIFLRDTLQRLLNDTGRWRKKWLDVVESTCRDVLKDGKIRHQSLMILLSFYMLTIITNRLRVAIDPGSALKMENETLRACASVFRLRQDFMACQFDARNNGSIQAKVADGTQQTAASWKEEIENARSSTAIRAEVFDEWCSLIGRTSEGQPPYPFANSRRGTLRPNCPD